MTGTPHPNGDEDADMTASPEPVVLEDMIMNDIKELDQDEVEQILKSEEKRFLLYVERGDVASVDHITKKEMKENKKKPGSFNLNCLDPLGRSALIISIENENMEMIQLLLNLGIDSSDSLLHAIAEEYVEGVEILLDHEERVHKPGDLYSWQRTKGDRATFTPDITPLIMAAHKNNYEILKLLLDRGAHLPMPHDVKCACDECLEASADDSLRHSLARINAYRALSSPSLICLSSKDPFITSFCLSEDLKKLASMEKEFCEDYTMLRKQVQEFSMSLVDETRTSLELEIVLNYDPEGEPYKEGEVMHFALLKEAVDNNQKQFVAHANVQQLLGTVWYDGMPGFRRRGTVSQLVEMLKIGAMFPVYCVAYMVSPDSKFGASLKKPFIKFIVHSASYCFFLTLLVIVSLRLETFVIELIGNDWMLERLRRQQREARGGWPSFTELLIVVYVFGFIWGEIRTLWNDGLLAYVKDLWNFVDFGANFFYLNWIFLRMTALFLTQRAVWSGIDPYYPREMWPPFDPLLVSEAMFCAANVLSFLKLIHIFSINHHLGPLQIALGRMVVDIVKFFFVYTLVLFAFGCGLNQLLWYYADIDKKKCYSLPGGEANPAEARSCDIWRRFSNLFETSQSLYWASFGLVDLTNFELTGIKSFTRFWSMLMYGSYNVINVIVLLNLLIAMMSNSYTIIVEKCDTEWKFARSKLWMSYFEVGDELPSPFNLLPNPHTLFKEKIVTRASFKCRKDSLRDTQYQSVTRNLVRRYVTGLQRKQDEEQVTEDDVNEVKQDISSFKYELLNILKINGYTTGNKHDKDNSAVGRKQQIRERRLMKGFNIGCVEGIDSADILANLIMKVTAGKSTKRDWNKKVRKTMKKRDQIGTSSISLQRQAIRQDAREGGRAWKAVRFYQRRGVFSGGEINERMLSEVKAHAPSMASLQSRCKGWRTLRVMHERGDFRDGVTPLSSTSSSLEDTSTLPETSVRQMTTEPQESVVTTSAKPSDSPKLSNLSKAPNPPASKPDNSPKTPASKPDHSPSAPASKPDNPSSTPAPASKPDNSPSTTAPASKPDNSPSAPTPAPKPDNPPATKPDNSPAPKPDNSQASKSADSAKSSEALKASSPKPAEKPKPASSTTPAPRKSTGWL